MSASPNIFILSLPVQSGKSTLIKSWLPRAGSVAGVLTPDVDGFRMLLNLASGEYLPLQVTDDTPNAITIGRFSFDESVFDAGNQMIIDSRSTDCNWVVIDEIGKLEIRYQQGFDAALKKVLPYFQQRESKKNLLLVIRDYLLDEAIAHYQLTQVRILTKHFFTTTNELPVPIGVVLCGGESKRMGEDKAQILYHGVPQYQRVATLLQPFCSRILLSVNATQTALQQGKFETVIDNPNYQDAGPLGALLSVKEQHPSQPIFLVGCDYPALRQEDLLRVFNSRQSHTDAVCYKNDEGIAEPLITLYEQQCFSKLIHFYKEGGRSLRQFLEQSSTMVIPWTRPIESIDSPQQRAAYGKR